MKEYLQLFRDQAFNGAFALLKRTLVSNILIAIILSVVGMLTIFPLILKGIGWGISDIVGFKDKMQSMPKNFSTPDDLKDFFGSFFGDINYGFLAAALIIALIFSAYQYVVFFKLNDNTVRNNNTSILDAIKMSLSSKVFSMLALYIVTVLICTAIFGVYALILVPLFMASKVAGVLVGFVLFFVVTILIIRFLIAPAALIHGNMGVSDAIGYSFKKITWKRGGILFLMGLVFLIALSLVSGLISSITGAIFGIGNTNVAAFTISQVISSAIGAVMSAFMYCSMTSIYFRYSDDMREESDTVEEHLISE